MKAAIFELVLHEFASMGSSRIISQAGIFWGLTGDLFLNNRALKVLNANWFLPLCPCFGCAFLLRTSLIWQLCALKKKGQAWRGTAKSLHTEACLTSGAVALQPRGLLLRKLILKPKYRARCRLVSRPPSPERDPSFTSLFKVTPSIGLQQAELKPPCNQDHCYQRNRIY